MTKNYIGINKMIPVEIKWWEYENVLGEQKTDKNVFLSQDLNNTGARRFTTMEMIDLEEYIGEDQNLYEIIHKDHPSKMYIDLDCKYNDCFNCIWLH